MARPNAKLETRFNQRVLRPGASLRIEVINILVILRVNCNLRLARMLRPGEHGDFHRRKDGEVENLSRAGEPGIRPTAQITDPNRRRAFDDHAQYAQHAIVGKKVEYIQENDAKYEKVADKLPFTGALVR